jgi:hypothetical protein
MRGLGREDMRNRNDPPKAGKMKSAPQRFQDRRECLFDFAAEPLVVCPSCSHCALVTHAGSTASKSFLPYRLICPHCGLTRREQTWLSRGWGDAPEDGIFHLPLWLQVPCCGRVLWAHNAKHLQFLKDYAGAELRERRRDPEHGWKNTSLASQLPKWMQLAKHRVKILRAVGILEKRLAEAGLQNPSRRTAPRRKPPMRAPANAGTHRPPAC